MALIRTTAHSDERMTEEMRFDNAMVAIFGDFYSPTFIKNPDEISLWEINHVITLQQQGKSLNAAIREVLGRRFKAPANDAEKREQDARMTLLADRMRKHIQRHEQHHTKTLQPDSHDSILLSPYLSAEDKASLIKQREDIFAALRAAGWEI